MDNTGSSKFSLGIKYGVITAIVYVILLLLQYLFCSYSPIIFTGAKIISFVIIIVLFLLAGLAQRKKLGGYGEVKEIFQAIFITILFAEVAYIIFSYIYLNIIDPKFMERFTDILLGFLSERKDTMPAGEYEKQVKVLMESKNDFALIPNMISILVRSIVIDSLIGLIISFILKRKNPQNDFGY